MNNSVCHISTVHPCKDIRIFYKECKTLKESGLEVSLIANHDNDEDLSGIDIKALPKPQNRFQRIFSSSFHAFRAARKINAAIYHLHDPELIPLGIIFKVLGKKVIYDAHEDVPKQILYKRWLGNKSIRIFVAVLINIVEHLGVCVFDAVIAATDDIAHRFPVSKTFIVRNYPIKKLIDSIPTKKNYEKPIIIYIGALSRERGIKEIIQSMEFIGGRAILWLLGAWENENFEKECMQLKEWQYTVYWGNKKPEEVYRYLKHADIGLSTLYPEQNYLRSLPIKAFEYMACSLPMLMSDFPYWQEIFTGCALFVNPTDPKQIAEKIMLFLYNPDLKNKLGNHGRSLVEKGYSWEMERENLIACYARFIKNDVPSEH